MRRRHFLLQSAVASAALPIFPPLANRPKKGIVTKDGQARSNASFDAAGTPIQFKLLSQDTEGAISLFVSSNNRRGGGPPLHVHHRQDEFFCVLEGEFVFQTDQEQTRLKAGDTIFIPRSVPHTFDCVSEKPGKLLVSLQPALQTEAYFQHMCKLLSVPDQPDMAALQALYKKHHSTILGPPLALK
jgi:quercetin dioxygenase-like cupin family protein